ncbi:MAG TPA: hypothetical protein VE136_16490, partial [Anaerolineales bacterium]|nr:hypothetical protein [Anaerolineales bacterium]
MKRLHGGTCGQPRTSGVSCSSQSLFWPSTVLRRTTFPGALFLGIVAILPWLLELVFPLARNANLLLVSSAGLLIVVGVVR